MRDPWRESSATASLIRRCHHLVTLTRSVIGNPMPGDDAGSVARGLCHSMTRSAVPSPGDIDALCHWQPEAGGCGELCSGRALPPVSTLHYLLSRGDMVHGRGVACRCARVLVDCSFRIFALSAQAFRTDIETVGRPATCRYSAHPSGAAGSRRRWVVHIASAQVGRAPEPRRARVAARSLRVPLPAPQLLP